MPGRFVLDSDIAKSTIIVPVSPGPRGAQGRRQHQGLVGKRRLLVSTGHQATQVHGMFDSRRLPVGSPKFVGLELYKKLQKFLKNKFLSELLPVRLQ